VVADALVRRGAGVIGVDLSLGMLRRDARRRPPAAVADVRALPVRSGALDLATAAFVLNHLEDPVPAVRELHRVLRPGGVLLASTFEGEAAHPAKAAVEQVVRSFGYQPPAWYVQVKERAMPVLAAADAFARAAREGGLEHVEVTRVEVGLALAPAELVAWRLGMAHTAAFVATLPGGAKDDLRRRAEQLVGQVEEPVELAVLVLRASAA
jgi:SAM-dependent methyltransferase